MTEGHAGAQAPGRLGPDSLIWKYYGDVRVQLFGFQRLASNENSIPELAQGVTDHSVIFGDFLGRAMRTAVPVMKSVYDADADTWGKRVRDFHKDIKGTMPDGSRYHALNPELFYWAHATFVDQLIYTTDMFVHRLSEDEKAQIFEESKLWFATYGVSDRGQPETYEQFVAYWNRMLKRFESTGPVVYGAGYIRKGIPGPRRVPRWLWRILAAPANAYARTMIAGTLPDEAKAACKLTWTERDEKRYQRIARFLRALDPFIPRLPRRLRCAPWAASAFKREKRALRKGGPYAAPAPAEASAGGAHEQCR